MCAGGMLEGGMRTGKTGRQCRRRRGEGEEEEDMCACVCCVYEMQCMRDLAVGGG